MNKNIDVNILDKVKIKTFQSKTKPDKDVKENENYFKLIGQKGIVIKKLKWSENTYKALVRFDIDIASLNLICHNEEENSLWIDIKDL